MDKLIISGRLGRDSEVKQNGKKSFVRNSVAVSHRNELEEKQTIWVSLTAYDKQAEILQKYGKKGKEVIVMGHLVFDPATGGPKVFTKKNGQPGAGFEIIVESIELIGSTERQLQQSDLFTYKQVTDGCGNKSQQQQPVNNGNFVFGNEYDESDDIPMF